MRLTFILERTDKIYQHKVVKSIGLLHRDNIHTFLVTQNCHGLVQTEPI